MELRAPLLISARLMPAVRIGTAWVSIEAMHRDHEGRVVYRYAIDTPDLSHEGNDLHSGCGDNADAAGVRRAMATLLSFLGACAEADDRGDNADLFPANVKEWAEANADELALMQYELEPDDG